MIIDQINHWTKRYKVGGSTSSFIQILKGLGSVGSLWAGLPDKQANVCLPLVHRLLGGLDGTLVYKCLQWGRTACAQRQKFKHLENLVMTSLAEVELSTWDSVAWWTTGGNPAEYSEAVYQVNKFDWTKMLLEGYRNEEGKGQHAVYSMSFVVCWGCLKQKAIFCLLYWAPTETRILLDSLCFIFLKRIVAVPVDCS